MALNDQFSPCQRLIVNHNLLEVAWVVHVELPKRSPILMFCLGTHKKELYACQVSYGGLVTIIVTYLGLKSTITSLTEKLAPSLHLLYMIFVEFCSSNVNLLLMSVEIQKKK